MFTAVVLAQAADGHGDAQRLVGELIHIDQAAAAARADLDAGVHADALLARIDGQRAAAIVQRPDGAHVDRCRQPLADEAGIGRLVDQDAAQQLGGEEVELGAARVAGGGDLATVEQRATEGWRHAAHADTGGLAVDLAALHGDAADAPQRLGHGHVGQLADVLGRHRLDDGGVVALGRDGVLDPLADAGDDDGVQRLRLELLGLGGRAADQQQQAGVGDGVQAADARLARRSGGWQVSHGFASRML
jgi:hypothetical protein